jgi:hypothetical protein
MEVMELGLVEQIKKGSVGLRNGAWPSRLQHRRLLPIAANPPGPWCMRSRCGLEGRAPNTPTRRAKSFCKISHYAY